MFWSLVIRWSKNQMANILFGFPMVWTIGKRNFGHPGIGIIEMNNFEIHQKLIFSATNLLFLIIFSYLLVQWSMASFIQIVLQVWWPFSFTTTIDCLYTCLEYDDGPWVCTHRTTIAPVKSIEKNSVRSARKCRNQRPDNSPKLGHVTMTMQISLNLPLSRPVFDSPLKNEQSSTRPSFTIQ